MKITVRKLKRIKKKGGVNTRLLNGNLPLMQRIMG